MLKEEVRERLYKSNAKYKMKADLKRREKNHEVGDLVLAYLRKERFPKREYNKIKLKKIEPCRILRKFSANASMSWECQQELAYLLFSMLLISDDTGQITGDKDSGDDLQCLKHMSVAQ